MRLWEKGRETHRDVLDFTVGNDYLLDKELVPFDCVASNAHAAMLHKIGVLTSDELAALVKGLDEILALGETFSITKEQEDCHTAIESYLTEKYGDVGKKIHLGRSRNDQVLTALRLYEKEKLAALNDALQPMIKALESKQDVPLPGYTHMQRAMPTSVGTWLGSFSAALNDDIAVLNTVSAVIDQSPLGTAAGFGVPVFELDREMTAKELGFAKVQENPLYAQQSRGKFEAQILNLLTNVMLTMNKLATDLLLFGMQEFGFVSLPEEFCTGSSIMPQKKNPDVLELVRAKYHVVLGEEMKVKSLLGNLMSGYNRDVQLTKEPLFTSMQTTMDVVAIMTQVVSGMTVNEERCKKAMTDELYATEEAYKLVKQGVPFRDAYKQIGEKYK